MWERDKLFACAYCKYNCEKRVSVLCAVNCSTALQNLYGRRRDMSLEFYFPEKIVAPKGQDIEIFDNYGHHKGHVCCRRRLNSFYK